ncbi:MAG: hypothetical protein ACLQGP_40715 [Isosphaeraceae bacterium]
MISDLIHDRGRGPEIIGTRITVYNLLPDFLDPTVTEAGICQLYDLNAEQVAAARAYVLNNPDTVLARHLQIEARMAAGNPPEMIEQAKQTRALFLEFKDWLVERELAGDQGQPVESRSSGVLNGSRPFPTFREWLAGRESPPGNGS